MKKRAVVVVLAAILVIGFIVWMLGTPAGPNHPELPQLEAFHPSVAPAEPETDPLPSAEAPIAPEPSPEIPESEAAQPDPAEAEPAPADGPLEYRMRVEAVIVDENGVPLEGVNVIVTMRVYAEDDKLLSQPSLMVGPSDGSGLVDRKANVQIGPGGITVARSEARITAIKEGYFHEEPLELEIEPGAWRPEEPLRIVMQTGAIIRGRLLNENGEVDRELRVAAGAANATVDENGDFELKPVKPGEVTLRVNQFGYLDLTTVAVRAGERLELGTLMAEKVATLALGIADGGKRIEGPWELILRGSDGSEVKPMTEQWVRIAPVKPGFYELEIRVEGFEPHIIRNVSIGHREWKQLGQIDISTSAHSGKLTMK